MPNPWVVLAVGVLWALSLVAVGKWQREDGAITERGAWLVRDNEQITAANAKIKALNKAAREAEAQQAAHMDAIGKWLAKENQDAETRTRRAVNSARALVLRQQPACPGPGGSASATPATAASGGDGPAACELPAEAVRDLLQLVGDADRDVRQLAACQRVIRAAGEP